MKRLLAPALWLALVLLEVVPAAAGEKITLNHNETSP
jgi:hypothetical protein